MLALQLARRAIKPLLIDRREAAGRGIAYGTSDPAHLLNVPAGKMSAWPDQPDDLTAQLEAGPGSFAERRDYGDYLAAKLADAVREGAVELVDGAVTLGSPSPAGGWAVTLEDGRRLDSAGLVLATGNGRPARFEIPGWPDEDLVQDPWSGASGERLGEAAREGWPLLLIGAGLTMVDVVLTLDRAGYRGSVTAVSRRGLVPRSHRQGVTPLPPPGQSEVPEKLSDSVAWLRARGQGVDWRSAIDSLRPVSQALWASWPEDKKARFARHARPWWDVHRHRIAPEAAAVVERWIGEKRLTVTAGRVRGEQDGKVRIGLRGGGEAAVEARLAVNCTGPSEKLADSANPLLRQLLADKLIAPGELGLGVRVDDGCRAGENLWAVGPLTKGRWWEITAVPDIRVQVAQVAETIADGLSAGILEATKS